MVLGSSYVALVCAMFLPVLLSRQFSVVVNKQRDPCRGQTTHNTVSKTPIVFLLRNLGRAQLSGSSSLQCSLGSLMKLGWGWNARNGASSGV